MKSDLERLRQLRKRASTLLLDLKGDLTGFLNDKNRTFRRRPEQTSEAGDVKVTTTCSCLMAIALSQHFSEIYGQFAKDSDSLAKLIEDVYNTIFTSKWESSGLLEDNPFSTVLVMRACGFLVSSKVLPREAALSSTRKFAGDDRSLEGIAKWLLDGNAMDRFRISNYPAKSAVLYWFVDAVKRLEIQLDDQHWRSLCSWAGAEFRSQRSLVNAQHEALMDPVAMAMSACLCAKLREIAGRQSYATMTDCLRTLPTDIEMADSIGAVFAKQSESGIWPKYFPLFHYPNAGSNFCFTFEMLEALLTEFGSEQYSLLDDDANLSSLELAVDWCFQNRLRFSVDGKFYGGWNSGGELDSLNDGKPESWATAVVHMFLRELDHALASRIQRHILSQYNASPGEKFTDSWSGLIDVPLTLKTGVETSLKALLEEHIVESAKQFDPTGGGKIDGRVSALLFGPPGTSKTRLTRAVAGVLDWPIVELDPSIFLSGGLENIYSRADEIFRDLLDLSGVVVLFDEMDALVQTRGGERLDVTSQFLTTSMLPKLARLHDHGRIVFFFATNYQSKFDQAIKRPGRFDLHVFMGPPTWDGAVKAIGSFLRKAEKKNAGEIKDLLTGLTKDADKKQREKLDMLTFSEKQSFLEMLRKESKTLAEALKTTHKDTFYRSLDEFSKYITLRPDMSDYKQWWEIERHESGLQ